MRLDPSYCVLIGNVMNPSAKLSLCVIVVLLGACASETPRNTETPLFLGQTRASPQLKFETYEVVGALAMAATNCRTVQSVETNTISVSSDKEASVRGRFVVQEHWTVNLCGHALPYRIDFRPDGKGGTYFDVTPQKLGP